MYILTVHSFTIFIYTIMKKILFSFFLVVIVIPLFAGNITIPEQLSEHPRLLLRGGEEQGLIQFIQNDSIWNLFQQRTLQACDCLLPLSPLEKVKIGKRMLGTSREALYRIFMLAYAYRTTGDAKYAERAEREMLHIAQYDSWNPDHFLDVAEMTMAMSIGYDWLYNVLNPENREKIRISILDKGLRPSFDKRYNGFLNKTNNWNQVCNTAMAYGAIALMETDKQLCRKVIERSITQVRVPMLNYGPDGAYPEGYGYWHYGTTYNVMLLAALESLYGNDFGLSEIPGFVESGSYILHMVGPTLLPFNFGDSGGRIRLNTSLFWFARKTQNPALLRYECKLLQETENYDYDEYWRMLPSIFILGKGIKLASLPVPEEKMFAARNETPVCLMRNSWEDNTAVYVGIKGGTASDNSHTHLDAGTFVMDAFGVRWAVDLGPQDYNSLESKGITLWDNSAHSQRWSVFRYNNFAHNVFSINDEAFNTEGRGQLLNFSDTQACKEATFDLTTLYNNIDKAERHIILNGDSEVVIEDKIWNGSQTSQITWRMLTPAAVEQTADGFILRQKGKVLFIELPQNVTAFSTSAISNTDYDESNPGITIIGYKADIAPNVKQELVVRLIPERAMDKSFIHSIADRVAWWQIQHQPEVNHHDLDWTNAAWYRGLAEWASTTNNEDFFRFLREQGEKNDWNVYNRLHHADDICVAQTYIELVRRYGNKDILKHTIARADSVLRYPSSAPLMKTDKLGKDERWSWSDALFMAPPVYAALSQITNDSKYVTFMQKEFEECTDSLYDQNACLYYRDCSKKILREPNGAKQFWARGNAWVFAAIPLLLDILPGSYSKRDYFVNLYKELAGSVIKTQDEQGSWHASLLDPDTYFQPENSASAFFCYGLAWGVRNGILESGVYKEPAIRAWVTLCSYVDKHGKLGYIQPVGNAPKQANRHSTDVYGVGAFLLAASEMLKLP